MVYDSERNRAYAAAMDALINPGSRILDLGSGLGIHGLVAAAKGAGHVYLVDPSPVTAIAENVAAHNGLSEKVTCIQKTIEQAALPEKVDVIISVFTGNFLLSEDLLPSLFYARDKYLKPSGALIPDYGEMRVTPVCAPECHEKYVSCWSEPASGLNFGEVRRYAANTLYHENALARKAKFLAQPATVASLDFHTAVKAECSQELTFSIEESGTCHGFLGWFRMRLGAEWVSTSPLKPAMHWSQVFLPLDPPLKLEASEILLFRLVRPQYGEWSWVATHAGCEQQHSTLFSRVFSLDQVRRHDRNYRVALNETGELAQFLMSQMNEGQNVQSIVDQATSEFAGKFSTQDIERHMQDLISRYGK